MGTEIGMTELDAIRWCQKMCADVCFNGTRVFVWIPVGNCVESEGPTLLDSVILLREELRKRGLQDQ